MSIGFSFLKKLRHKMNNAKSSILSTPVLFLGKLTGV